MGKLIDQAVQAAISNNNQASVRQIVRNFGVPESTLRARIKGRSSPHRGQADKMLLHPEEELGLLDALLRLVEQGWTPSLSMVRHMAGTLVHARDGNSEREVGKHWASRFLNRHSELTVAWSSSLDKRRAVAGDPERVKTFLSRL